MKSSDETLDHVLRGLADVQPSGGLEDRVLAKVRARTLAPAPWHASFRQRAHFALPLWGIAVAGLAILAIASAVYVRHDVRPSGSAQISPLPQAVPALAPTTSHSPATTALAYTPHGPIVHVKKASDALRHAPTAEHPSAAPCDCDSLAMQEWHAPSQPAPELPLTHEERLLQGFAYRGNTQQLAALTPAFRAAEQVREQADFQTFFTKPTSGDNE